MPPSALFPPSSPLRHRLCCLPSQPTTPLGPAGAQIRPAQPRCVRSRLPQKLHTTRRHLFQAYHVSPSSYSSSGARRRLFLATRSQDPNVLQPHVSTSTWTAALPGR
ncbi:hypothetical protein Droror1_Dr00006485 [Drosera rotundifolia]